MVLELVLPIAGVAGAIIVYILNRMKPAGLTKIYDKLCDVETRLTKVETKTDLWWKVIETKMIDVFHSPHTPEIDNLLEHLRDGIITLDELTDLKVKLNDELNKIDKKDPKYIAGVILVAVLEAKEVG